MFQHASTRMAVTMMMRPRNVMNMMKRYTYHKVPSITTGINHHRRPIIFSTAPSSCRPFSTSSDKETELIQDAEIVEANPPPLTTAAPTLTVATESKVVVRPRRGRPPGTGTGTAKKKQWSRKSSKKRAARANLIIKAASERPTVIWQIKLMALYHVWATKLLISHIARLTDEEFDRDLKLYFRSIHGTLCHLVAADRLWLNRLRDGVDADVKWATPLWASDAKTVGRTFEEFIPDRLQVCKQLLAGAEALESYVASLRMKIGEGKASNSARAAFQYLNTKGQQFEARKVPILMHIFNRQS